MKKITKKFTDVEISAQSRMIDRELMKLVNKYGESNITAITLEAVEVLKRNSYAN